MATTQITNKSNSLASTTSTTNPSETVQEYSIRVPKNGRKKFHLMRFNATLNIDFAKWSHVKMERENNMREFKGIEEDTPKFGAGSEFGRDAREEARRKKLGFNARKYKPDDQPWLLKTGGKTGKKFKGIREGGFSENASYYVFTHAADGAIEAFPLQEWYNFTPIQCYKALSAEEAEQEFGKRNRVLNFFSLMMRKRLRGDEDVDGEDGGTDEAKGRKSSKKQKELKISEMDEWMSTSSDESEEEGKEGKEKKDSDEEKSKKNKNKGKGKEAGKKKKPRDTDAEAFEDSDDGDDEGRELDYISSSSESEVEAAKQLQGVAEEKALRKLLTSDEDSEEEENKSSKENSNDEENEDDKEKKKDDKDDNGKKKKKSLKKKDQKKKKEKKDSSSDTSSDSDSDSETKKKKDAKKEENKDLSPITTEDNSATNSRSPSPSSAGEKRKLNTNDTSATTPVKKPKLDMPGTSLPSYLTGSSDSGITEDAVRRYLMRKPMTTTELLQKFKTKKTGLSSEQLVNIMTQILKKINPIKQTIKGKMYLSIKQTNLANSN